MSSDCVVGQEQTTTQQKLAQMSSHECEAAAAAIQLVQQLQQSLLEMQKESTRVQQKQADAQKKIEAGYPVFINIPLPLSFQRAMYCTSLHLTHGTPLCLTVSHYVSLYVSHCVSLCLTVSHSARVSLCLTASHCVSLRLTVRVSHCVSLRLTVRVSHCVSLRLAASHCVSLCSTGRNCTNGWQV